MSKNMLSPLSRNASVLAPVAVFTYSRVEHFIQTIESLRGNYLADQTILYVVSDGAKFDEHKINIEAIRNYTEELRGFERLLKYFVRQISEL